MSSTVFLRRVAFITIGAIVGLPLFARAQASTLNNPLPSKVFYACYIPSSGVTYRIKEVDLKQSCSSTDHVMFSWTDGGVAGPQGPIGPQGPQGPQGPAGTPGWSQMTVPNAFGVTVAANALTSQQVDCPAGTTGIGGGHEIFGVPIGASTPVLVSSFPNSNGWHFVVSNKGPNAADATFNAYAICAK
jgi:hypothetical protein